MKNFKLGPEMIAVIGNAFYPTGHSMVMFPSADDAQLVGKSLTQRGFSGDDIYLIPPETVLREIVGTTPDADDPLPSAGTEGATVRAYAKLAREGHTALLVRTEDEEDAQRLMEAVRQVPYSIAQRYRKLVIEDL